VPPFMKEGAKMRGESMMGARGRDDYATGSQSQSLARLRPCSEYASSNVAA